MDENMNLLILYVVYSKSILGGSNLIIIEGASKFDCQTTIKLYTGFWDSWPFVSCGYVTYTVWATSNNSVCRAKNLFSERDIDRINYTRLFKKMIHIKFRFCGQRVDHFLPTSGGFFITTYSSVPYIFLCFYMIFERSWNTYNNDIHRGWN